MAKAKRICNLRIQEADHPNVYMYMYVYMYMCVCMYTYVYT